MKALHLSTWLVIFSIENPPFFAIQLFPLARKSLGGIAVDLSCRVLDKKGRAIPNLYAVGELTGMGGINGQAALEGTMLGYPAFSWAA